MTITLSKGGSLEREIEPTKIQIPDLWQIAMLPELEGYRMGTKGQTAKEMILECWHLAHDMRNALMRIEHNC